MARPYGKFKRSYARRQPVTEVPRTVRFGLGGKNDLEQASALFEIFIAELQRQGVAALENIEVTCDPIRGSGDVAPIRDEKGEVTGLLKLRLPTALRFAKAISF